MPSVTVVTAWYEHPEHAKDFWAAMRVADATVLVIDNGGAPNGVRLGRNVGYCHASNVGLWLARTDAVLFLNNDVFATSADWLERLSAEMRPGVLVGANIRSDVHAAVDGVPMPYIDGWCLGGMRDDLLSLGGLDETFVEPAYYSDNDLCLRARARGMSLVEVRTGIHHKLNGSTDPSDERTVRATIQNRETYLARARELLG